MRLFGFEINRSRRTAADYVVWNPAHRRETTLGDLTPAELREELARVHQLAVAGNWYWINRADHSQKIHVIESVKELEAYQEIQARDLAASRIPRCI